MDSILLPTEVEYYIEAMQPQKLTYLGTERWLEWHQRLQKLNQEATIEASCLKEEHVKETLITFGKLPVLVHEAILVNVWKYKVLPKLLKLVPAPENTFLAYSIMYHEGVCVSLLELAMFHSGCCEALEDAAVDLLDYASGVISQLLSINHQDTPLKHESPTGELMRQRHNLTFEIGIRCLSILRYLCENLSLLPLTTFTFLYKVHDIPVLLTEVLLARPWYNNGRYFIKGRWRECSDEQVSQSEAQVWLSLRYVLLDTECRQKYPITESRRNHLVRLLPLMRPELLDQISPLMELKHWLCKVSCIQEYAPPVKGVLLETILDIKERIMTDSGGQWTKVAQSQVETIFGGNRDQLQETARKLTEAYNTDLLEKFACKDKVHNQCAQCGNVAIQRCSRCKQTWYCSRTCQVTNWGQHKENCTYK